MELQHAGNAVSTPIISMKQTKQLNDASQMEQTMFASMKTSWLSLRVATLCLFVLSIAAPFVAQEAPPAGVAPRPVAVGRPLLPDAASLVTEFDVNGLKVLAKRREGS